MLLCAVNKQVLQFEIMDGFSQADYFEKVYSSTSNYAVEDGLKIIELLAPQRGDKVLDVGCGTGYLTKILADLVGPEGKVVGVDPDVERLKIARDKYPAGNLEYLEGTAENTPGSNSTYDIVFSNYVLHWCKDRKVVFNEIAAKLKPGGKFGFVAVAGPLGGGIGPEEMFSPKFFSVYNKLFYPLGDSFRQQVESIKITFFKKHVQENKLKGVSELIKRYMTHLQGRVEVADFNIEAMKRHFGEGEVSSPIEVYDVILVKSQ